MKIGFTGTRNGLTENQKIVLEKLLRLFHPFEFHHGGCRGADYDAHKMCIDLCLPAYIHIHPGPVFNKIKFPWAQGMYPPKQFLIRNHDIVNSTDLLLVCPKTKEEILRSGTWATYRYAKKMSKPTIIIYPDGTYILEIN